MCRRVCWVGRAVEEKKDAEEVLEERRGGSWCQLMASVLLRTVGGYVVALKKLVCRLAIVVVVGFSDERVMEVLLVPGWFRAHGSQTPADHSMLVTFTPLLT